MRVTAQEVLDFYDETMLSLTIDQALEKALSFAGASKEIPNLVYQELLGKLGVDEGEAFTLALAAQGIRVVPEEGIQMASNINIDLLKKKVRAAVLRDGCLYEDAYYDICRDVNGRAVGEFNSWLMNAQVVMKRNPLRKRKKPGQETEYKKDVRKMVQHPDVRKMASKVTSSYHLNKALDELADDEYFEKDKTDFMPPWISREADFSTRHDPLLKQIRNDPRTQINWMERSEIQALLESAGFAVYDNESDEDLREALYQAVEAGDITLEASKKTATKLSDSDAIDFVMVGFEETNEVEHGSGQYTEELKKAIKDFEDALWYALDEWVDAHQNELADTSDESSNTADMYNESVDVYFTLNGEGVGIWDGRWDHFFRDPEKSIPELTVFLKEKLGKYADETGGGSVNEAFTNAVLGSEEFDDEAPQSGLTAADKQSKYRLTISDELRKGIRPQGSELMEEDVGRKLATGFGKCLPIDIGKRIWLKDYGFVMENDEKRDKRKGVVTAGIEDLQVGKEPIACPECGTKYEYEDTVCVECGTPRDNAHDAFYEDHTVGGQTMAGKKTAKNLTTMATPDLSDAVEAVSWWVPEVELGQIEEYVYGALENFVSEHVTDGARWDEWLGDKFTARNFFELSARKTAQRIEEEKRQLEDTIRSRQNQIPGWKKLLDRVRKALDFSELAEVWESIKGTPAFAKKEGNLRVTADDNYPDLKEHMVYTIGRTINKPELRGKKVVFLGWVSAVRGDIRRAKVALLNDDGSQGEEYLVNAYHIINASKKEGNLRVTAAHLYTVIVSTAPNADFSQERNKDPWYAAEQYGNVIGITHGKPKTVWDVKQFEIDIFEEEKLRALENDSRFTIDKVTPTASAAKIDPVEAHIKSIASTFDKAVILIDNDEAKAISAYIANDDIQKTAGLEVFDTIQEKEGMLFPFDSAQHVTFYMGKVKFPIDILFLLDNGLGDLSVKKVVANVQPGSNKQWSCSDTTHVLELVGGTSKKLGVEVGTVCSLV